jgi:hypothetical protein
MTVGLPSLPPTSEHRSERNSRGVLAAVLAVVVILGSTIAWWQRRSSPPADEGTPAPKVAAVDDSAARAPAATRVRVRVVNISGVTGLARRTTQHLRTYGYDVVDFLSTQTDAKAATRIAVHTGHTEWGTRVQKAMGLGTVTTVPDSSRYADLTVFVGRDWRPPTKSFRP